MLAHNFDDLLIKKNDVVKKELLIWVHKKFQLHLQDIYQYLSKLLIENKLNDKNEYIKIHNYIKNIKDKLLTDIHVLSKEKKLKLNIKKVINLLSLEIDQLVNEYQQHTVQKRKEGNDILKKVPVLLSSVFFTLTLLHFAAFFTLGILLRGNALDLYYFFASTLLFSTAVLSLINTVMPYQIHQFVSFEFKHDLKPHIENLKSAIQNGHFLRIGIVKEAHDENYEEKAYQFKPELSDEEDQNEESQEHTKAITISPTPKTHRQPLSSFWNDFSRNSLKWHEKEKQENPIDLHSETPLPHKPWLQGDVIKKGNTDYVKLSKEGHYFKLEKSQLQDVIHGNVSKHVKKDLSQTTNVIYSGRLFTSHHPQSAAVMFVGNDPNYKVNSKLCSPSGLRMPLEERKSLPDEPVGIIHSPIEAIKHPKYPKR